MPVSCNVSCLKHLNDVSCLVLSQPNPKCLGLSLVLTPVSWQMSLFRKNVLTPSLEVSFIDSHDKASAHCMTITSDVTMRTGLIGYRDRSSGRVYRTCRILRYRDSPKSRPYCTRATGRPVTTATSHWYDFRPHWGTLTTSSRSVCLVHLYLPVPAASLPVGVTHKVSEKWTVYQIWYA